MTGLTVTDEMLKAYWRATQAADLDTMADAHRAGLQAVLDLIASTVPEPVEGPPGTVPVTLWLDVEADARGYRRLRCADGEVLDGWTTEHLTSHGVPISDLPKPPWTSPLPNLPDLTEQQCRDAYDAGIDPYCYDPWAQIGRALKAAGWTPVEEADRG